MAVKPKASRRRIVPPPLVAKAAKALSAPSPPLNLEERLHRIEAMGKRIDSFIRFMVQIAGQTGTSTEMKERAVTAFYEQMVLVERQLGRIHDEVRLE